MNPNFLVGVAVGIVFGALVTLWALSYRRVHAIQEDEPQEEANTEEEDQGDSALFSKPLGTKHIDNEGPGCGADRPRLVEARGIPISVRVGNNFTGSKT